MSSATVCVRLLGGLEVTVAGAAAEVPRGVASRLLLLLAAHGGRVVRDDVLIDRLWADEHAPRSMGALRNAVMRLRSSLGTIGADAIERVGDGYRLSPAVEFDVQQFEAAVAAARAESTRRPDAARRLIDEAFQLVRGDPFADVAGEPWARPAVAMWTERIADAEELLGEVVVTARDRTAVDRLEQHAFAHPERELRWIQLITLLHAVGRSAESLRVYRQARTALAEFGIAPSAELRALEARVLHDDVAAAPVPDLRIIGRDRLVADILAAMRTHRSVTLVGLGGVGKTTLAREILRLEGPSRRGGATFVDLTSIDADDLVEGCFVSAAGLGSTEGRGTVNVADVYAASITEGRSIVVVDNAEHVRAGSVALITTLVRRCSDVDFVVTSRDRLGYDGEFVVTVTPLPVPPVDASPEECAANASVRLLNELVDVGDSAAPDPQATARIVRAVGGLPLGIELAAAIAMHVPVADLADALDGELHGFDLDRTGQLPRQRLSAVFQYAIDQLGAEDRRVLGQLSVFPAPFTARSAESVVADDSLAGPLMAVVARLADASLVSIERSDPTRYWLTPLQRAAAARQLDDRDRAAVRKRVERWYRQFADEQGAALRGSGQAVALRTIAAEYEALHAVAHDMLKDGRVQDALGIAGGLADYWFLGRNQAAGEELLVGALDAAPPADSSERLRALVTLPRVAGSYSGVARHEARSREALDMAVRLGRADLADEARLYVGAAEAWTGRFEAARSDLTLAAQSTANEWASISAELVLGLIGAITGPIESARRDVYTAAHRRRAAGDRFGEANAFLQIGMAMQRHGASDIAEADLRRSVEVAGDDLRNVTVHAEYGIALILDARGDGEAREMLVTAQTHFRRVGDLGCLNGSTRALADIARRDGDDDRALEMMQETVWLMPDVDEQETAASFVQIAEIYLERGHVAQAATLAAAAAPLAAGAGIGWNTGQRTRLQRLLDGVDRAGGRVGDGPPPIAEAIQVALVP